MNEPYHTKIVIKLEELIQARAVLTDLIDQATRKISATEMTNAEVRRFLQCYCSENHIPTEHRGMFYRKKNELKQSHTMEERKSILDSVLYGSSI
jgi:hypothetical protein